jgi:aspartate kinase
MQEMAESGAKVLHARAVEWAKRQNIAILARKTADFAQQGEGRQTRVHATPAAGARAVVTDRNVALLSCPQGRASVLLDACSDAELVLRDSVLCDGKLSVTLPLAAVPSVDAALAALAARVPELELVRGVGTVSDVGVGAGAEGRDVAALLGALGASPRLLVATPLRVSAVLEQSALAAAEAALHARLTR